MFCFILHLQSLQAPTNHWLEVRTTLANLGASELALQLLHVVASRGELGRRTSEDIAQPLCGVNTRSAVPKLFSAAPPRVEPMLVMATKATQALLTVTDASTLIITGVVKMLEAINPQGMCALSTTAQPL